MRCPKCEHDNLGIASFCAKCGTPCAVVSNALKWGIVALEVVPYIGATVGAVMGIKFWCNSSPAKKSVGKLWTGVAIISFVVWFMIAINNS
jgi:hypothetical protein